MLFNISQLFLIAEYNNYAASLVSSYLPPSLSKNFARWVKPTNNAELLSCVYSDAKSEPDCEIAEPSSKVIHYKMMLMVINMLQRKKVNVNPDNPTEDYYTKFNMAQSSKATVSCEQDVTLLLLMCDWIFTFSIPAICQIDTSTEGSSKSWQEQH